LREPCANPFRLLHSDVLEEGRVFAAIAKRTRTKEFQGMVALLSLGS
jgi:hypothetical protein